jgi:lysophospholipase L1-like esterase
MKRWVGCRRKSAVFRRAAVIIAVLAGAMALVSSTASAQPAGGYVALGDSYSSGVGTGRYDLDPGCQRSSLAYPYLWQAANRPAGFEFLACGGARIGDVRGQATESALLPQAELVTLTAGGNDVGVGTVLSVCTNPSVTDDQCYAAVEQGETVATSAAFHDGMVSLLATIGNRAPDAHVEVLGYPTLFEETTTCAAVAPSLPRRVRINDGAEVLRSAIKKATKDYQKTVDSRHLVQFVDVNRYFEDHRICSPEAWINGFVPQAPGESFHPNAAGHARGYLRALTTATKRLDLTAA